MNQLEKSSEGLSLFLIKTKEVKQTMAIAALLILSDTHIAKNMSSLDKKFNQKMGKGEQVIFQICSWSQKIRQQS